MPYMISNLLLVWVSYGISREVIDVDLFWIFVEHGFCSLKLSSKNQKKKEKKKRDDSLELINILST